MAQVDSADVGGYVEPDQRQAGYRWVEPGVDAAAVLDQLDAHARGDDDRDAAAAGVNVQVDDVVVEFGLGEVEPAA